MIERAKGSITDFSSNSGGTLTPWAVQARICITRSDIEKYVLYLTHRVQYAWCPRFTILDLLFSVSRKYNDYISLQFEEGFHQGIVKLSYLVVPKYGYKQKQRLEKSRFRSRWGWGWIEHVPWANPTSRISSLLQARVFPNIFSSLPLLTKKVY